MRIAAQLYTLRDLTGTPEGFDAALARVAGIGYAGVQLSAVGCLDVLGPEAARAMMDAHGLACPATHRAYESIAGDVAFHRVLGCDYVAPGVPPSGVRSAQEYRAWTAGFPALMDALGEIRLGYHNHAFEWQSYDGERPFDVLVEEADPRLQFELDTYWAVHAGVDLVPLIGRLSGRLDVVHAKDKEVVGNEGRFAPVGEGNLGWERILPAFAEAGTRWLVVEQDETYGRDPFDCLASSFDFLTSRAP